MFRRGVCIAYPLGMYVTVGMHVYGRVCMLRRGYVLHTLYVHTLAYPTYIPIRLTVYSFVCLPWVYLPG
jgi:hypothetical protein